jgi:hypothetical protein
MSSRPEAGAEDARDDGPELQDDAEIEEQEQDISSDSPSSAKLSADQTDHEDVIPELVEDDTFRQSATTGNLDTLQERRTRGPSLQLRKKPSSEDETSSVPDDTPSVQVLFVLLAVKLLLILLGIRSLFSSE